MYRECCKVKQSVLGKYKKALQTKNRDVIVH